MLSNLKVALSARRMRLAGKYVRRTMVVSPK